MVWLLSDCKVGDEGVVVGLQNSSAAYRKRLMSMGLNKGVSFTVTRVAPLGDPMEINVRGYSLTLRKDEVAVVSVEKK